MKKLIASILASSMTLGIFAGVAGAESRTSLINKELEKKDEIHILYNDKMVQYEDVKPINNEDRIMIPFRAALENMGASVEYDDNERLVTATKGDRTIHFTLLDDIIYINNNGEESTITMDVPMIIVQDRTLVPIRFMSNALGMQVGWDGDTQTVVIMDYSTYFDNYNENIPNLNKLNDLKKNFFNTKEFETEISVDKAIDGAVNSYFTTNIKGKTSIGDNSTSTEGTLLLETNDITVEQTDMTAIFTDDNKIYLQSQIINTMSEDTDESDIIKAAESDSVWYSIDLKVLLDSLGINSNILGLFKTVFTANENKTLTDLLLESVSKEGDAVYSEAIYLATAADLYERLDKYIEIDQTSDSYSINVDASPDVFLDIISDILGLELSVNDKNQLLNYINYTLFISIDSKKNIQKNNIYLEMAVPGDEGTKLSVTLNEKATNEKNTKVMTAPSSSYDITPIVLRLIPHNTVKQ